MSTASHDTRSPTPHPPTHPYPQAGTIFDDIIVADDMADLESWTSTVSAKHKEEKALFDKVEEAKRAKEAEEREKAEKERKEKEEAEKAAKGGDDEDEEEL